jgi:phosphoglycolate phosphatase-like HAD superfamily hydrolase
MFPNILALDFDGVICDGLIEYFVSTKEAYKQIWTEADLTVRDNFAPNFYHLRPVIETGWEMPVLLRALVLKYDLEEISTNWTSIRDEIVEREQLNKKYCSQTLDRMRDNWIQNDLSGWLKLHHFYPGILEKLKYIVNSEIQFYIVTTKEGRFVKQLLEQQGIDLTETRIIGKECKRSKYETLRIIKNSATKSNAKIWFLEDRIQALKEVQQQPDLKEVKLFLAGWGYNTESERTMAKESQSIELLSLDQFAQDFDQWVL